MEDDIVDDATIYTTKTGGPILGVKQDTLKIYAIRSGIGNQPGGPGTPYYFTRQDLLDIREWKRTAGRWRRSKTQMAEDREALGVGPMYDITGKPGK